MLRRVPGVDLRVVHLVRDSRGVAYSWTKEVARPEARDRPTLMPQLPAGRGGRAGGLRFNSVFHVLGADRRRRPPALRYEDARCADPRGQLGRILDAAGLDRRPRRPRLPRRRLGPTSAPTTRSPATRCGSAPARLDLRRDDAWRRADWRRRDRRVVTALTAPLLAAYGYLRDR